MIPEEFIQFGDLRFTISLVGAVWIYLIAQHAVRSAYFWAVAAAAVFGIVALSKILHLAWGLEVHSLAFKALSGHAAGAALAPPVALYLIAAPAGRRYQYAAITTGWFFSTATAYALVVYGEHTASEALAGWLLGVLGSAAVAINMNRTYANYSLPGLGLAVCGMVTIATVMHAAPVGWWLVKAAQTLSGAEADDRRRRW